MFDTSRTWASWCSFIVSILTILGSKQTYLFPFGFLEPGSGLSQARLCRVRLIIRHHHKMFQNQSCHKIKIMLQGWITHLWNRRIGCSSHQIWFLNSNHHSNSTRNHKHPSTWTSRLQTFICTVNILCKYIYIDDGPTLKAKIDPDAHHRKGKSSSLYSKKPVGLASSQFRKDISD